jgi:hypothetical protein
MIPFHKPSRNTWICLGPASSFPNITESTSLTEQQRCNNGNTGKQLCRVFIVPTSTDREESSRRIQISKVLEDQANFSLGTRELVLVFQYKGKFHAIDNVRTVASTSVVKASSHHC